LLGLLAGKMVVFSEKMGNITPPHYERKLICFIQKYIRLGKTILGFFAIGENSAKTLVGKPPLHKSLMRIKGSLLMNLLDMRPVLWELAFFWVRAESLAFT